MKICMFTNTYLPHVGGVARSVHFFAEDLRSLGHEVLVVAPTFSSNGDSFEEDSNILRVPAIQNFNGSDFSVRIPIPFYIDEEIDAFEPEVVHSHHPFLLGDAAIRAALRRNLPLVFTHHTLYEQYTHYVSADSDIMKQLAVNLSTEYANLCTRVVAPSESIASLIARRGVTTQIEVIPTGVDVDHFKSGDGKAFRRQYSIPENVTVVGHLGRLAPEKNLEYLASSVIEAMQDNSDDWCFLVVGSGPSASRIEEMFARANLEKRLIMAGKKQGKELVDSYAAMDLFVFSSQSETQGMVLVEAMSASLPVIALDASGAREVVRDGVNGRLLDSEAGPKDFAEAIENFLEDEETAARWQKEAFATAEAFSRKKTADKMADLYREMLANAAPEKENDSLDPLDELVHALKIEWDLLSGKASALLSSIQDEIKEG